MWDRFTPFTTFVYVGFEKYNKPKILYLRILFYRLWSSMMDMTRSKHLASQWKLIRNKKLRQFHEIRHSSHALILYVSNSVRNSWVHSAYTQAFMDTCSYIFLIETDPNLQGGINQHFLVIEEYNTSNNAQ